MNQIKRFVHSPLWVYFAVRLLIEPIEKVGRTELKEYEKAYTCALESLRKSGRNLIEDWLLKETRGWLERELNAIHALNNIGAVIVADHPDEPGKTMLI